MQKLKIKKHRKNRKNYVVVKKIESGLYDVYFDFVKVPVRMSLSYLSNMVNKDYIGIKEVLY